MSDIENLIKRKIKIRKFAIDNLGLNGEETNKAVLYNLESFDMQEDDMLFKNMIKHIQAINDNWYLNLYRPICSDKKVFGPFIVFIKKVIRKIIKILLGWYIFPVIDAQNTFNANAVNSINLMKDIIVYNKKNDEVNQKNLIEKFENKVEELTNKLDRMVNQNNKLVNDIEILSNLNNKLVIENKYILKQLNVTCDIDLLIKTPQMDYLKFENKFRGSRDDIKNSQKHYVNYFKNNGGFDVLDIGCGRGEFLELMFENGISARGIDIYEPFIQYCNSLGFRIELGDALTFLNGLEDNSIGGIFMGQVIEHLSTDYTLKLINLAYRKLVPGSHFIIETPNPETISTYKNFYLDVGHIKPVHFLTLEYFFQEANYSHVEKFYNEFSKYPFEAKHIKSDTIENSDEFNNGIDAINELIFGYRDYTLIARK